MIMIRCPFYKWTISSGARSTAKSIHASKYSKNIPVTFSKHTWRYPYCTKLMLPSSRGRKEFEGDQYKGSFLFMVTGSICVLFYPYFQRTTNTPPKDLTGMPNVYLLLAFHCLSQNGGGTVNCHHLVLMAI